jgi:hypothetical protein
MIEADLAMYRDKRRRAAELGAASIGVPLG